MRHFGDLLNEYIQRIGISDAELARTVGVSRQTVFRWREGLTARPRHRQDVLTIARKLRLTPAERNRLLLAAGFRPEDAVIEDGDNQAELAELAELNEENGINEGQAEEQKSRGAEAQKEDVVSKGVVGETAKEAAERRRVEQATRAEPRRLGPRLGLGLGLLAIIVVGGLGFAGWSLTNRLGLDSAAVDSGVSSVVDKASDETLPPKPTTILIIHFANYASSQVGYNMAGRLAEALQRELDDLQLEQSRIDIWPEAIAEREDALRIGQEAGATLVIYGEYDVGRVVVKFAYPTDPALFTDPALSQYTLSLEDLSTAINSDLPQQVRSLALIALGQIHLNQERADRALPLLTRAYDHLNNAPDIEPRTWAVVNFFLGLARHHSQPPHLDEAIAAYGEAIEHWPEMVASRLNRIAAYEARNRPGDLKLALTEADALVEAAPAWALSYNNRASIRLSLGGPENLALAVEDLDQTLALDPTLPPAYLNRAIARFGQGHTMAEILPDAEEALRLRPGYGNALNLLCWGYGLEGQPEMALPYCERAVEADPDDPLFRDSRGLSYALVGQNEQAIADFEHYAAWLEAEQPGEMWERDVMRRRAWSEALATGDNPFTPEVLGILREEFGQ